jgi:hypothetical protein
MLKSLVCILSQISLTVLNFNKTHYVEFRTKNYYEVKSKLTYDHIFQIPLRLNFLDYY